MGNGCLWACGVGADTVSRMCVVVMSMQDHKVFVVSDVITDSSLHDIMPLLNAWLCCALWGDSDVGMVVVLPYVTACFICQSWVCYCVTMLQTCSII